ncbi:hypothetical protein GCM10023331_26430 [Algivirga pacifica]|uniref:DUF885 domain-containing protein n=1 Tax=Algivirga pacifica TaxID=1162670 RepID=A0ABP9DCI1_9BACT
MWGVFSGLCLSILGVLNVHYFKPDNINRFFERMFYEQQELFPEKMTSTQLTNNKFVSPNIGQLNYPHSLEKKREQNFYERQLEMYNGYRTFLLTPEEKASAQAFQFMMSNALKETILFQDFEQPFDPIHGIHQQFIDLMLHAHQIRRISDAHAYIERLNNFDNKVAIYLSGKPLTPSESLDTLNTAAVINRREGESLPTALEYFEVRDGFHYPNTLQLKETERQLQLLLELPLEENPFYQDFHKKLSAISFPLNEQVEHRLTVELKQALEESVIPSLHTLLDCIQRLKPYAVQEISLQYYEGGHEYYTHRLGKSLGLDEEALVIETTPDLLFHTAQKEIRQRKSTLIHLLQSYTGVNDSSLRNLWSVFKEQQSTSLLHTQDEIKAVFSSFMEDSKSYHFQQLGSVGRNPIQWDFAPNYLFSTIYTPKSFHYAYGKQQQHFAYLPNKAVYKEELRLWALLLGYTGSYSYVHALKTQTDIPLFRQFNPSPYQTEGWSYYLLSKVAPLIHSEDPLAFDIYLNYHMLVKAVLMAADIGIHDRLWNYTEVELFVMEHTKEENSSIPSLILNTLSSPSVSVAYFQGDQWVRKVKKSVPTDRTTSEYFPRLLYLGGLPQKSGFQLLNSQKAN